MSVIFKEKVKRRRPLPLIEVSKCNPFPREPLKAVRRYRYFLNDQHERVSGLRTFESLARSLTELDKVLGQIEFEFRRYMEKEIDSAQLLDYLAAEAISALSEFRRSKGHGGAIKDGLANEDAAELAERLWEEAVLPLDSLEDALSSAFEPRGFLASSWDKRFNRDWEELDLWSFAAITDEPEVAAQGHDRTIINIKLEHLDAWFTPEGRSDEELFAIFDDRRHPQYELVKKAA